MLVCIKMITNKRTNIRCPIEVQRKRKSVSRMHKNDYETKRTNRKMPIISEKKTQIGYISSAVHAASRTPLLALSQIDVVTPP